MNENSTLLNVVIKYFTKIHSISLATRSISSMI